VPCKIWMGIFFTWHSSEHGCHLDVKWKPQNEIEAQLTRGSKLFTGDFRASRSLTGFRVCSRQHFPLRYLRRANSRIGLDSDAIIHRRSNPLLATQVAFRRLNGHVAEEKLDLLQLSSRGVAESGTSPALNHEEQVLPLQSALRSPSRCARRPLRSCLPQGSSHLCDATEDLASVDSRRM
jgi:hypothetical protein